MGISLPPLPSKQQQRDIPVSKYHSVFVVGQSNAPYDSNTQNSPKEVGIDVFVFLQSTVSCIARCESSVDLGQISDVLSGGWSCADL